MTILREAEQARPALMPELTPAAELAVLARVLYREGWDDHDGGHITYRQPDDTLLTVPLELCWDEITASDIIRIDFEGNKLEGMWSVIPGIQLHLEYHHLQPHVNVTIHQHPRFGTVWSGIGRIPPAYDQRSTLVADEEITFYDDYDGTVDGVAEAKAAAAGIGSAHCALLRNHGAFVVGDSIPQAMNRAISLEWRCKQAWHVEAVQAGRPIPEVGKRNIAAFVAACDGEIPLFWEWAVRREVRFDPAVLG